MLPTTPSWRSRRAGTPVRFNLKVLSSNRYRDGMSICHAHVHSASEVCARRRRVHLVDSAAAEGGSGCHGSYIRTRIASVCVLFPHGLVICAGCNARRAHQSDSRHSPGTFVSLCIIVSCRSKDVTVKYRIGRQAGRCEARRAGGHRRRHDQGTFVSRRVSIEFDLLVVSQDGVVGNDYTGFAEH